MTVTHWEEPIPGPWVLKIVDSASISSIGKLDYWWLTFWGEANQPKSEIPSTPTKSLPTSRMTHNAVTSSIPNVMKSPATITGSPQQAGVSPLSLWILWAGYGLFALSIIAGVIYVYRRRLKRMGTGFTRVEQFDLEEFDIERDADLNAFLREND